MEKSENPESLLKFFKSLEAGGQEGAACEMHYGCQCVLRKARQTAEMLVGIQQVLGLESVAPEAAPVGEETATSEPVSESTVEEVAALKTRSEQLLAQNMKLVNENLEMKQKIQSLHRQINRLYDIREMQATLKGIESGSASAEAEVAAKQEIALPEESGARHGQTQTNTDETQKNTDEH